MIYIYIYTHTHTYVYVYIKTKFPLKADISSVKGGLPNPLLVCRLKPNTVHI